MKSGRKLFFELEDSAEVVLPIQRLSNGDLRSLLTYLKRGRRHHAESPRCDMILALAMCEAVHRWVTKGKGKAL